MAIFSFPPAPVIGQNYTGPNGVTYTWDGEKWVGASTGFNPDNFIVKTPAPGNEQFIVPGQPTDTALTLKTLLGQAGNIFEILDSTGTPLTVFDENGWLGVGKAAPLHPIDVIGNISLTGGIVANGSIGASGYVLTSDGSKSYWAPADSGITLDDVLGNGNFSNKDATVGNMNVQGDLNVQGSITTINTEVINLADNIITLNSNYSGNTPNENAGIEVNRGNLQTKRFYWDEILDRWTVGTDILSAGTFLGNLTGNVTGTVSSLANHTTDSLPEGQNNLYFTQARARNALGVTGDLQYNPLTGIFHFEDAVLSVNGKTGHVVLNSDDIPEGNTNLYLNPQNVTSIVNQLSINELADVNTTGAQGDYILYWDAFAGQWLTRPGDFIDEAISALNFDLTTGDLFATTNEGNTTFTNLDGRYLNLSGGTLTGTLIGADAIFENLNVNDSLAANSATFEYLAANNLLFGLGDLIDVDTTAVSNGYAIIWDANTSTWISSEIEHPAPIIVSPDFPTSPLVGTAWYDSDATSTTSGRTFVWDGLQWIDLAPATLANQKWSLITASAVTSPTASITQNVLVSHRKIAVTLEDMQLQDTVSVTGGLDVWGNCSDGSVVLIDSIDFPTSQYPMSGYFEFFAYYNGGVNEPTTYLANKYKKTLTSVSIKPKNAGDSILSGTFMVWVK